MRIFITGATGFIGAQLTRYLLAESQGNAALDITCLVRDARRLDATIRSRVTVLTGDLREVTCYAKAVQDCDYVFHIAANASVTGGLRAYRENIDSTRALFETLQNAPHLKRFVFTSSIGAIDRQTTDDCSQPLIETSPSNPVTLYGKSKWDCERLITESALPYTIVRPTWVYGPNMRLNSHVAVFAQMVKRGHPLSYVNFPGQVSVIYIDDLIECLWHVARAPGAHRQAFFASDGNPVTLGQIFRMLGQGFGQTAGTIALPEVIVNHLRQLRPQLPLTAQNLFSHVLWADNTKLMTTGFIPTVDFQTGVLRTLRWMTTLSKPIATTNPVTVITGAASGIGKALAQQLYVEGHALCLVDKNQVELNVLAKTLDAHALCLDLAQPSAWEALSSWFEKNALTLGWLINNAGIGARGPSDSLSFEQQQRIVEVNCLAVTYLSRWAISQFRKQKHGVLINVASSAAFQPLPFMAVYAASKAYVRHFTHSLAGEVQDAPGISVLSVSPSGTATRFQVMAGVRQTANEQLLDPAWVARKIITAACQRHADVIIGRLGQLMSIVSRLLPSHWQILLWRRLMEKHR